MYLLDTNVLSDSLKLSQYPQLQTWLASQLATHLFISSISLAELSYGVSRLPEGKRKEDLYGDLSRIAQRFSNRILSVDAATALRYGAHHAAQVTQGLNDDPFDSFIIATALEHQLTVVTRNLNHFQDRGVSILSPY